MDKGLYSVIDANLNRAVEGLRVSEDLLRFHYRAAEKSSKLKDIRHRIFAAAASFSYAKLLDGRDVPGDAQKFIEPDGGKSRDSAGDVLRANLHRAMEAVRSLEETSKLLRGPEGEAGRFQEIRFSLYGIEKEIAAFLSAGGRMSRLSMSLYAILDSSFVAGGYENTARRMIDGGAGVIQLRMKEAPSGEYLRTASSVAGICRDRGALFIVNDRPDIALLSGADGVHLGQDDLPVREARRLLPDDMIVGLSTHSLEQARAAAGESPDYIAIGPLFGTASKTGRVLDAIGTGIISEIRAEIDLPIVGIGGITPKGAGVCIRAGCTSLAVISFLYGGGEVEENCRAMVREINAAAGPSA